PPCLSNLSAFLHFKPIRPRADCSFLPRYSATVCCLGDSAAILTSRSCPREPWCCPSSIVQTHPGTRLRTTSVPGMPLQVPSNHPIELGPPYCVSPKRAQSPDRNLPARAQCQTALRRCPAVQIARPRKQTTQFARQSCLDTSRRG